MFSATDQGEAITVASRWDVRDNLVRSIAVSGGNKVGDDLHRETIGNRGAVGCFATNI